MDSSPPPSAPLTQATAPAEPGPRERCWKALWQTIRTIYYYASTATTTTGRLRALVVFVLWLIFTIYYAATATTEVAAGKQCLEPTHDTNYLVVTLVDMCTCVPPELENAFLEPLSLAFFSCLFPRKLRPFTSYRFHFASTSHAPLSHHRHSSPFAVPIPPPLCSGLRAARADQ